MGGPGRASTKFRGPGRAGPRPGPNKNINTKPRLLISILIKTDYKLYFRPGNECLKLFL